MSKIDHFWAFARDADQENPEERTLYFDGPIASESWYDDEITPAVFRAELYAGKGPITVYVNSEGGDCVAASQIYTLLIEYPWDVLIKVYGLAASAASVVCMAGTRVLMSPTSFMYLHNPFTVAMGNTGEMQKAIERLDAVKESIISAYQIRTGLSHAQLSHMMDDESWITAQKAISLGFADGLLTDQKRGVREDTGTTDIFSSRAVSNSLMNRVRTTPTQNLTPYDALSKRLLLINH
ncbi:ATP-dependent Clp protease proteolytic subunit [Clostridia bacterium]|nr:ATP-dependent Clp protease proteolytic subunit [Clostridia bacterium]